MRKTSWISAFAAAAIVVSGAVSFGQTWRGGNGRVEGNVKDASGNPIVDATIAMRTQDTNVGPDIKVNKKGHWAILGIVGGLWNVDISAPGYQSKSISYLVKEFERNPPIDVALDPEVKKVAPHEEITVGGKKVTKETAEALDSGNGAWDAALKAQESHDNCRTAPAPGKDSADAMSQCEKEAETIRRAKFAEATGSYEKALPELPDNTALLTKLEMAGYLTQNYDQAEKYAKVIVAQDPANATSWLMVAELELQKGNLADGKAALEKVPPEKITDATVYMNMGIICYNKNNPVEAGEYFSKAIAMKGDLQEAFYYRGLSRYQEAGLLKDKHAAAAKRGEARADFQRYMEIDPNGKDADTVKELLKSIK